MNDFFWLREWEINPQKKIRDPAGIQTQDLLNTSVALREWESVGIWLRPLGYAAYVACLPLLHQGSMWLSGTSVCLVFRRSWVQIPARSSFVFFFRRFLFLIHSLNQKKASSLTVLDMDSTILWMAVFWVSLITGLKWTLKNGNLTTETKLSVLDCGTPIWFLHPPSGWDDIDNQQWICYLSHSRC